jgi:hypothetical protein
VEYDDGDHEWIHLLGESDRVQVQQEDGLWNMVRLLAVMCAARRCPGSNTSSRGIIWVVFSWLRTTRLLTVCCPFSPPCHLCLLQYTMYQSEALQNETRKREARRQKETYQQQAFRDANQWRSFLDDVTKEVMFLSNITGTRCGVMLRSKAAIYSVSRYECCERMCRQFIKFHTGASIFIPCGTLSCRRDPRWAA